MLRFRPILATAPVLALLNYRREAHHLQCESRCVRNAVKFPETLVLKSQPFKLFASGVRKVTFLSIAVYDVGIYVAEADLHILLNALRDLEIDSPGELRRYLSDPVKGTQFFSGIENVSYAIRIIPVRNTDIAHMRDGFVRGIMARQEPDESSLQAFKEFFPNPRKAFLKNETMLLTLWEGRKLELDIGGHDYGVLQNSSAATSSLLRSFLGTYISGKKVASEEVRNEFIEQLCAAI